MNQDKSLSDIAVIGLGVMGKNLALNIADNHFNVSVFDIDSDKVQAAVDAGQTFGHQRIRAVDSMTNLLASLTTPRRILLSVPAGKIVDVICQQLIDAGIEPDDIVIDSGNSLWTDTIARTKQYQSQLQFFAVAVSGGEEGARVGPSLMPSGSMQAWQHIAPIFTRIAAQVDPITFKPIVRQAGEVTTADSEPCCSYIGPAGSGHYVKMVHNGIEYADMQLICEAYDLLSKAANLTALQIADIFDGWAQGRLSSYLMEISADILRQQDPLTGKPLVEIIADQAGQKGTGLWTAVSSLQLGVPAPTIAEAVYARAMSAQKSLRVQLSQQYNPVDVVALSEIELAQLIGALEQALYAAKVCCYAQGFELLAKQASEQDWQLNYAEIAKLWRAGCIIRASFLQDIVQAYASQENQHLLQAEFFVSSLNNAQSAWRQVVITAVTNGVPIPSISASLAYFDSYRSAVLPANLLQAQRDYFGAHTFKRIDQPEQSYHFNWSEPEQGLEPR
ncbi:NADP-dependent phosphogluconate dehydrogenase [Shewanella marina]|uniref:NADP-dependent phosphogluconate dehydrogenase n=1 Tax=Shewanella marina TaxID=487319 RepID=UPI0004710B96|nr:NADP-dependent phosphogluconate dehydrogenase [Shewanella marina]